MPKKYPNTSKKALETPYSENPCIRITLSIILYTFLIYLCIRKVKAGTRNFDILNFLT